MLDLVGNPEDRFSQNEAHFHAGFLMTLLIQSESLCHAKAGILFFSLQLNSYLDEYDGEKVGVSILEVMKTAEQQKNR